MGMFLLKRILKPEQKNMKSLKTHEFLHESVIQKYNSQEELLPGNLKGTLVKLKEEGRVIPIADLRVKVV